MMRASVVSLLAALFALRSAPALAQPACGDTQERGVVALAADLDCTGSPGPAIVLSNATLKLNGFAVRGGDGVVCAGRCKVAGPGVVENSAKSGIWSNLWFATRYTITKVEVRNNALWGVAGFVGASEGQSRITLSDSVVEGNGLTGVFGNDRIVVARSEIRGNGTSNGGAGVFASRGSVKLVKSMVQDNLGVGVSAFQDASLTTSTVTGNAEGGVIAGQACFVAGRAAVGRSTVTGNATGACAPGECADVASCAVPIVRGTTCDTSHQIASGLPGDDWNVCASD